MDPRTLDPFTLAYLVAALWSSTDDDGNPLDDEYGVYDFEPTTLALMVADCANFQDDCAATLDRAWDEYEYTLEQAGHDFWLTRNGHGAGFWDRGIGAEGRALTTAAEAYGEVYLYANDGKVWCH